MSESSSPSSLVSRSGDLPNEVQHFWYLPNVKGNPPVAREGHSANVVGCDHMYIFAGRDGPAVKNDLHVLNTDKMIWRQVNASGAPSERSYVSNLR